MKNNRFPLCIFLMILCATSAYTKVPMGIKPGQILTIKHEIDLGRDVLNLPSNVTLRFCGGRIVNGTIVGKKTQISGECQHIFDKVIIKGSWLVDSISTEMFVTKKEDNFLRTVVALSNPDHDNVITIEKGDYHIKLIRDGETGIFIPSRTKCIINGNIFLRENKHGRYNIIETNGVKVHISGSGMVFGDLKKHKGNFGEWGHGITIWGANGIVVENLSIKECWGDCLYVGGNSKNILIENCDLGHSRRQGISITSGDNIKVNKCNIHNIFGVEPQHGIDVEPNPKCSINNATISGCKISKCYGGIMVLGNARNAYIGSVRLSNCTIDDIEYMYPVMFMMCDHAVVINNSVTTSGKYAIQVRDSKNAVIKNNMLNGPNANLLNVFKCGNVIKSNNIHKN